MQKPLTSEQYVQAYDKLLPGFKPFPVVKNEKRPLIKGWQQIGLVEAILAFENNSDANIGLAVPEGYLVLDIDHKSNKNGYATLRDLEDLHGELPTTLTQSTPSGGQHKLFKLPLGVNVKNEVEFASGLDIRSAGGLIVCEPSQINGKPYTWIDWTVGSGEVPEIADAPDWLITAVNGGKQLVPTIPNVNVEQVIVEGGRNSSLFKKASAMRGQGCNNEEIELVLQSMNKRLCVPNLPDAEVTLIAHSAAKYAVNDHEPATPPPLTAIALKNPQVSAVTAKSASVVPDFLLSVPGKLGLMVDWTNETAPMPQPYFAVQAALALGSVVLGRMYRTTAKNWSTLYFLNIARSATGKEHAKKCIEDVLCASDLQILIGPSEYTSDAGVDSALIDKPTHIAMMDEFGLMLQAGNNSANSNFASARKKLMEVFGRHDGMMQPKAYSTAGLTAQQRDARGSRLTLRPANSLFAMTTPDTFYSAIGSGSLKDGFLNRIIIVESVIPRAPMRMCPDIPPPQELCDWAKTRRTKGSGQSAIFLVDCPHDQAPEPIAVAFDSEAAGLFQDFSKFCVDRQNALEEYGCAEMYGRSAEIAMKVALIVSQSCESESITASHATWAIEYVQFWAERAITSILANIADSPFASLCNDVANIVTKAGMAGVTIAELSRASAKFKGAEPRVRDNVFKNLREDRGVQFIIFKPTSGRGPGRTALVASEFIDPAYSQQ
ncbi:bifunctional DNA primase/polymerase [Undibacterium sp.]|uniref:bifunctional DNA primase/polymerase n=1 Tax=Undibacterium sp. TaxID=1914977 RepID=UPI0025E2738F|nr:bifunctional DNA primase/polymerase [Undibacterium sp.]